MGNPFAPKSSAKSNKSETPQETKAEETTGATETVKTEVDPKEIIKATETVEIKAEESKAEEAKSSAIEVPDTTIEGVLDWVGEDKKKAAAAIENEKAQPKPRKTLISKLEEV